MAQTGRPRTTGQVVGVADGKAVAWDSGVFAGDAELADRARLAAGDRRAERLHALGSPVPADPHTAVGAAAAIMAAAPGRMVLVEFPAEVAAVMPSLDPEPVVVAVEDGDTGPSAPVASP